MLNGAETFEMTSRVNSRHYKIFVSVPAETAPADGWPVLYTSDGNAMFPQFAATANLLRMSSQLVLVGIGYPSDGPFNPDRRYFDLTPTTSPEFLASSDRIRQGIDTGGADLFLEFIESEVKPVVERIAKINRSRQSLFGHSLGGLLVLHSLFTNPGCFQNYVAAAPSLWWDNGAIFKELQHFQSNINSPESAYRVLLLSNTDPARSQAAINSFEHRIGDIVAGIVTDSYSFVKHHHFEDESHISMAVPSIVSALKFVT